LHGKLSEPLWPGSRQPPQKTSRVVRQREQVKGAPVNYFGRARFMADPCQKKWKRVGADRSNRILRLVDLLNSCVLTARPALLEVFEVTIYPAVRDDVQPLRKRASLVNRLIVALSWWRRKQNYGARNQEPGKDQGLSALPHGWEDSMTAKEAKDAVVNAFWALIKGRSDNCDIRALSLSRLLSLLVLFGCAIVVLVREDEDNNGPGRRRARAITMVFSTLAVCFFGGRGRVSSRQFHVLITIRNSWGIKSSPPI
jgi:hypothetical protein